MIAFLTGCIVGGILTHITTKYYNRWKKDLEDRKNQKMMRDRLQYVAGITKTYRGKRKKKRIILHG